MVGPRCPSILDRGKGGQDGQQFRIERASSHSPHIAFCHTAGTRGIDHRQRRQDRPCRLAAERAGASQSRPVQHTYIDGDFAYRAIDFIRKGGKGNQLKEAGILPDLKKRGAIRSVIDGRYMYARYFSPKQHNRPTSLEQIRAFNDVELYDLKADPLETVNLAAGSKANNDLVLAMNDKLNRLIDTEVGDDNGSIMPGGVDGGWEVSAETMKGF